MVLLRLACLTWYLQYCVQHQPWCSTWYLQGTQLLREPNLSTAYCHNQCPKAQVSALPRIFMMMKYWTSFPTTVVGHFRDSSWTKVLTLLVVNFEIQIKARPFELTLKPNWPSCLQLSSSTALEIKTQSYVLDFQNPFLYLPGPLMRAFHVRPPNIFILFLISFFSSSSSSSSVLFLVRRPKICDFFWPWQKFIVINLWTKFEDQVVEPSRPFGLVFVLTNTTRVQISTFP